MAERISPQSQPFFEAQQEVRRLFQEMIHQPWGGRELAEATQWQPCCDIAETEREIIVEIELPGVERKHVRVEVKDNVLRITGERRAAFARRGRQYYRTERSYGRFERHIRLPSSVNQEGIRAHFRSGILTVTLPKKST